MFHKTNHSPLPDLRTPNRLHQKMPWPLTYYTLSGLEKFLKQIATKGYICDNETSRQHIKTIRQFFSGKSVKKAYVFGSYSRNEAHVNSDIDILVELDHTNPIGLKFFTYGEELQDLLKKKVDMVSDEGVSKYVKPFIDKDKVLIYER